MLYIKRKNYFCESFEKKTAEVRESSGRPGPLAWAQSVTGLPLVNRGHVTQCWALIGCSQPEPEPGLVSSDHLPEPEPLSLVTGPTRRIDN